MDHAFRTIFGILNTILNWADNDSFLHSSIMQVWDAVEDIQDMFKQKKNRIQELEQNLENIENQYGSVKRERDELEQDAITLPDIEDEALADYAEVLKDAPTKAHFRECICTLFGRDNQTTENLVTLLWMMNSSKDPLEVIKESDDPEIRGGLADMRAAMEVDDKLAELGEGSIPGK